MDKKQNLTASNPETVTISRAEYEKFQAQSKRISELESRVDVLMEALRLARHKQFGTSSEKSEEPLMEQLSFLFNEAEVFAGSKHKTGRSRCCRTIVREDIYYTYACKSCSENADEGCETPMVKAPKERTSSPAVSPHRKLSPIS